MTLRGAVSVSSMPPPSIAQVGWVVQIVVPLAAPAAIILGGILVLVEMTGPVLAERQAGGTPWHAHHIAERHSLFAIIALGEGVVGTVAALSAVVDRQGWTLESASQAWGSPSACGGSITSCRLGRSSSDTMIERR